MTPEVSMATPGKVLLKSFPAMIDTLAPVSSSMEMGRPQTSTVSMYGGTDDGTIKACVPHVENRRVLGHDVEPGRGGTRASCRASPPPLATPTLTAG
ncbi:hypothetical protein MTO96_038584 [Rhipicephalus appendiculatus]